MKKIMFSIMALLASAGIHADNITANLKMCDGSVSQIVIDASSEIELQRSLLKIHAPVCKEYDVLFLLEDVADLSFEHSFTGIHDIAGAALSYRLDGEKLSIDGITDASAVQVYDASGVLLNTVRVQNNACNIPLANLPKGMLLIKANRQTIKIVKQ